MIKRLIFDMDNTLLPWRDEYNISLNRALDRLHYQYDANIILKLVGAVDNYENEYLTYNETDMLKAMNRYSNQQLPNNFIALWLDELSSCYEPANCDMIETLDYLSNKYDLVVLTNWFASSQIERLKNVNILKYFSHVYCADSFPMKPHPESYLTAIGEYDVSECVMIGDSIKTDIEGAKRVGMNTIFYNEDGKKNASDYKAINKINDLMDIL